MGEIDCQLFFAVYTFGLYCVVLLNKSDFSPFVLKVIKIKSLRILLEMLR